MVKCWLAHQPWFDCAHQPLTNRGSATLTNRMGGGRLLKKTVILGLDPGIYKKPFCCVIINYSGLGNDTRWTFSVTFGGGYGVAFLIVIVPKSTLSL